MSAAEITVRHCHGLAEFERCVQLQLDVWGGAEIDAVPLPVFVIVAEEMGGQVFGAFDGGRMIGFTLAMPGLHGLEPHLHSHMTAVLEPYRDKGVGRKLKLFQRDDALARGIPLVEWTFDPLELRNAHFNIVRLGAIVRRFLPNHYGVTTSPLHAGLPTDRLLAEWWLDSPHAKHCIAGSPRQFPEGKELRRIFVPSSIGELKGAGDPEAATIQMRIRKEFQKCMGEDFAVTGLESTEDGANYILEPYASAKDLSA
ncbi:MAG: acetyltransferase [Acidobacteria bacterium]|nr:acetyltransferase [Acidobacteriota bacterium]